MGPRYVRLLEEIDRRGSIREACAEVGLSYRTCLNRVRQMERVLGHRVIHTTRGGASGGGSELTYLEFGLRQGAVVISGRVRKPGPPAISADFTAWIGLALSSSGDLTTEVLHTSVDVIEWYAEVADFVSGGAITRAADAALRSMDHPR